MSPSRKLTKIQSDVDDQIAEAALKPSQQQDHHRQHQQQSQL